MYIPRCRINAKDRNLHRISRGEVSFDTALYLIMRKLHEVYGNKRSWYASSNLVRDTFTNELLGVVDHE